MRYALKAAVSVITLAMLGSVLSGCEYLEHELKPEEAVALAHQATDSVETAEFDIKIDMESGGVPISVTGSGAMELPMSFEMSGTMTVGGGGPFTYEQRMVGGKQYLRSSLRGDTWWIVEGPGQSDAVELVAGAPSEYFAYFEVVERTEDFGVQRIRGVECRHLLLEIDEARLAELLGSTASTEASAVMASSTMRVDVWIAQETGLPMREVVDTTMELPDVDRGEPVRKTIPVRVRGQIDFNAFDTPVEIVVPAGAVQMLHPGPLTQ